MTRYSNPGRNSGVVLFHWFYMHETKFHCEKKFHFFQNAFLLLPTFLLLSVLCWGLLAIYTFI